MFCEKCGKEISKDSVFCEFCGHGVEKSEKTEEAKNQPTTLDNTVKISIIVGALIVALSVAYYLVIYIPQRDKMKIEQQKQEQQAKEEQQQLIEKQKARDKDELEVCLAEADSNYWAYAKLNGTEKKDGTVYADNDVWDRADKTKQAEISNCYRKYPQQ